MGHAVGAPPVPLPATVEDEVDEVDEVDVAPPLPDVLLLLLLLPPLPGGRKEKSG
jgi:hypothetical protein